MIDQLIAALNQKIDLSAEEIADTLWLAMHMEQSDVDSISRKSPQSQPDLETTEDNYNQHSHPDLSDKLPTEASITEQESTEKEQEDNQAGVYNQKPDQTQKSLDIPFKVPDAPSLREQLDLARALRPLMRRIPSGSSLVLDEAATTQRIADEGIWLPVIKPTLEPWLDLELVVDEGISMQIWRHTIKELQRLLTNYGIFRDVRVWGLISNGQNMIQIRRGIGSTAKNQPARSAAELIDSSGRRLVLLVSDCVSDLWRNGDVNSALKTWANNVPTAIIQMLPKWLWARTALGWATEVRFQGLAPAVSNRQLIANTVSLWSEIDEATGIKVPVFTLERDRVANWAQMLVGKGSIQSSGYVFKPEARNLGRDKPFLSFSQGELTAEQRVQAFRVTASPMARKLAGLLASAPVISLPVVRLIQETMLQDSQQVHVAEVFLGGLLKPLSDIEVDTAPDYVQYGFIDGVRELLVDSVPSTKVLNVVEEVSKFVAKKVGLSLSDFAAVLRNPEQVSDSKVIDQVQPFAIVTAQVLRRLGGEYLKIADKLTTRKSLIKTNQVKSSNSLKILIFGVDHYLVVLVENVFTLEEYDIISTPYPDEVQDLAIQSQPNLICILNILSVREYYPDGDGITICQKLRKDSRTNAIPILISSRSSNYKRDALKYANDFISNPFDSKEYLQRAKNLLHKSQKKLEFKLSLFRFKTITVNNKAKVLKTETKQAQYFTENLDNNIALEMVAIPSGTFIMGSSDRKHSNREKPSHRVKIHNFFMGKYPVTQAQWRVVAHLPRVKQDLDTDPSHFQGHNRPVENISWYDAVEFCDRLSKYTGREYRLPSEAEWEYACRAGTTTAFHFGKTLTPDLAIYGSNRNNWTRIEYSSNNPTSRPKPANHFGLFDMHGTVWEWCADSWHVNYDNAPTNGSAWIDNNKKMNSFKPQFVVRGGSWGKPLENCSSSYRQSESPEYRSEYNGFRVVCNFEDEEPRNYQEDNLETLLNEIVPYNQDVFIDVINQNLEGLLLNKTVTSYDIPDDNNEATIDWVGSPNDIEIEVEWLTIALFSVRFNLKVDCGLSYFIFKADYYSIDDDKANRISISDYSKHYYSVEENYTLKVEGIISVDGDTEILESSLLAHDELLGFLEKCDMSIDSIDEIEVDS